MRGALSSPSPPPAPFLPNSSRGSVTGRAAKYSALRMKAAVGLDSDYFCRGVVGETAARCDRFEKQWRMPKVVYERLRVELIKEPYFDETKRDAAGYPSCFTDQKMCAALVQLVEGVSSRAVWNYLKIVTSTAREALKKFSRAVVKHFKAEYL